MDSGLVKADSTNPYAPVDVSPMDISYYPVDYPVQRMSSRSNEMPQARVIYSRPHRQGRRIFGSLVKYGTPWRLGANEATEIEFFQSVTIQGKKVDKGRYVLYAIPRQDSWTIVFNSSLFAWGLTIDPEKDLFRFDIPIQITNRPVEHFSMVFEPSASGANLQIAWDTVMGSLPIQFK
jgi:hypothetical protein